MSDIAPEVLRFAEGLNSEVRESAAQEAEFSTEIECFAAQVLDRFVDGGVIEEPEVCVRSGRLGRSQWEIAGWAFPPSKEEDLSELALLAVLFGDNPEPYPVSADDVRRRFELAVNFVSAMLDGRADELEPAAEAAALGRIIHDRRAALQRINLHLATDGLTQRLKSIESTMVGPVEITYTIWDIERLSRLSDPKQLEVEIDIPEICEGRGLPCLQVPEDDPHYDAYLCVVPGKLLYHAYEMYGQRLLELNVRAFLSAAGKVNSGIRKSIREQPDRFFAYNNGLAMTARRVEIRQNSTGHPEIVKIFGLQIVNGGQTTASIHRAWKVDGTREQIEKVFVQGKLVVITTDENDDASFVEMVRSISKFANSQNAVKDDDLEANQPWHVELEKLSRSVWTPGAESRWYYERSRGAYATEKVRAAASRERLKTFEKQFPRAQLITKTDLAKAWNAWSQRPEIVSRGGQKNFRQFMLSLDDKVRRPSLDESAYKKIVGQVILFRSAVKLINELRVQIPAYRANLVTYLVSYLSFRTSAGLDFERIWDKQALPEPVTRSLRNWAEPIYRTIIETSNGRNVTEWCKTAECWSAVRALDLDVPANVRKYISEDTRLEDGQLADSEDAAAISDCIRLTIDEWDKLLEWVSTHGAMGYAAPGIVATLRGHAMNGWTRKPSAKQARASLSYHERWRSERRDAGDEV